MHLLFIGRIVERQKRFSEAIEIFESLSSIEKKFDVVGSPVPEVTAEVMKNPDIVFHGYKKDWSNLVLKNLFEQCLATAFKKFASVLNTCLNFL